MFENLKSQGLAKPEVFLGHPFSSVGMAQRAKEVENLKLQFPATPVVCPRGTFMAASISRNTLYPPNPKMVYFNR
jgi:hypothetical protein